MKPFCLVILRLATECCCMLSYLFASARHSGRPRVEDKLAKYGGKFGSRP